MTADEVREALHLAQSPVVPDDGANSATDIRSAVVFENGTGVDPTAIFLSARWRTGKHRICQRLRDWRRTLRRTTRVDRVLFDAAVAGAGMGGRARPAKPAAGRRTSTSWCLTRGRRYLPVIASRRLSMPGFREPAGSRWMYLSAGPVVNGHHPQNESASCHYDVACALIS